MKKDQLDELIIDSDTTADTKILAEILGEYIRFTKTGEILFEKPFDKEKEWKKVILFLLSKKVITIKKLKKDAKEESSPTEISEKTFIANSTVRRSLKRELKNIVVKSGRGLYKIPNYNLRKCKSLIKKDIEYEKS